MNGLIKKKENQLLFNLLFSIINFGMSAAVGFFLTSYITNVIGSEAYGFNTMASDFTSYIAIFTTALNYLSNRFISISYNQNDIKQANKYFNTVLIADIYIAIIVMFVSGVGVVNLQKIIDIPFELVPDVKLTFILVFLYFGVTLIDNPITCATYITNRMDINSVKLMIQTIIRGVVLLVLFSVFSPHIYYVPLSTLIGALFGLVLDNLCLKKLSHNICIDYSFFDFSKLKEVLKSGIWNSITQVGLVLNSGLDLIITNQFIDSYNMGLLAVSKMIPGLFDTLNNTIFNALVPQQTILYAQRKKKELTNYILQTTRIISFVVMPLVLTFLIIAKSLLNLWLSSKTALEIEIIYKVICILTFIYPASCVYKGVTNIPIMYNKQRFTAIQNILTNFAGIAVTLILLLNMQSGIYAVAGVSIVFTCIGNLFIYVPYSVKLHNAKFIEMYFPILINVFKLYLVYFMAIYLSQYVVAVSWVGVFCMTIFIAFVCYIMMFFLILKKEERCWLLYKVKKMEEIISEKFFK